MRVALAVNATSGRGAGGAAGVTTFDTLSRAGYDVVRLVGRDAADLAAQVAAEVTGPLRDGGGALVVVGGDGMVNLGVDATAGTSVPLGIVAAGTGNDVARAVGLLTGDPVAAAARLLEPLSSRRTRTHAAARCTWSGGGQRWFAGVLGAGFDAVVNERANGWSWPRGPRRYDLAVARELPSFRPRSYRIVLDDDVWQTSAMLVAVGNGPAYGGGMRICPDALLDDGLLDVVVVEPVGVPTLLRLYPKVYAGRHVEDPRVHVRRARRVRLEAEGIVGYADGERFAPLPLDVTVVPGALRLLL